MSESIKQRMGHFAGDMNAGQLKKLFDALRTDLVSYQTQVAAILVDVNNLRTQHNAVLVDLKGISNNTGSANNTYQLTAVAAAAATGAAVTLNLTA